MCQRHGPQESPGTEVLKKRFLFADCYVCQTACCLLQCSAKGSIAMLARCVLYGHSPKQDSPHTQGQQKSANGFEWGDRIHPCCSMILWYEDGLLFLELKTTRQASTGPCLLLNFYHLPISNFRKLTAQKLPIRLRIWPLKNAKSGCAKPFKTLGCCRIGFHRYEGYWRRNFRLQKDQHGLALCVATDNLLGWRFGLAEPSVTYQWLDFESQLEWNFTGRSTWTSLVILQNSLSGWLLAILKTLLKECVQ